jgi:hypothetical protein
MGREAEVRCVWRGEEAVAKVLLEAQGLILRDGIRATIARTAISCVVVERGALRIDVAGEPLILELGAAMASRWAAAILKSPPTLASKLGISKAARPHLIGDFDDAALAAALAEGPATDLHDAAMLVVVLRSMTDLAAAFAIAEANSALPLWCVYAKGPTADLGGSAVRAFLRNGGWIDSKSSAVSERLTATRYSRKA